jgi:hypothetical protein
MTTTIDHSAFWFLVRRQHGVISREQLLELGFSAAAIRHRVERGRLVPLWRGVFSVGRLEPTREALWMAAVLAAGPGAALSQPAQLRCGAFIRPARGSPVPASSQSTSRSRPACPFEEHPRVSPQTDAANDDQRRSPGHPSALHAG